MSDASEGPPSELVPSRRAVSATITNRLGLKIGLSLLIGGAFAWLLHRGALPLVPPTAALSHIDRGYFALGVLSWAITIVIRAARWQLLLGRVAEVPMRAVLRVSFIGYAALIIVPLRAGELVRPLLIRREGKLS